MSNTKYTDELSAVKKRIRNQLTTIQMIYEDGVIGTEEVMFDEFGIAGDNVEQNLCSLADDKIMTICNVRFRKGGYVKPHKHDRQEQVFVISGKLYDPVNDVLLQKGEVYNIDPEKLHAFQSDDALLTVSWRPAYPTIKK